MSELTKLPKIQDLVSDVDEAFKNDQFKLLVNQNPPNAWIKTNKYANNSIYVPIDKVEYLLDKIIQHWKVEILEAKPIFNSIMVTIRLHYRNPVDGIWYFHDGVGCKELQTRAESGTLMPDFSNISKGATEIAAPIAKTQAIKDACDHIGRIFGRDLNRKDVVEFQATYQNKDESTNDEIKAAIDAATDREDIKVLQRQHPRITLNKELMELIADKKRSFE